MVTSTQSSASLSNQLMKQPIHCRPFPMFPHSKLARLGWHRQENIECHAMNVTAEFDRWIISVSCVYIVMERKKSSIKPQSKLLVVLATSFAYTFSRSRDTLSYNIVTILNRTKQQLHCVHCAALNKYLIETFSTVEEKRFFHVQWTLKSKCRQSKSENQKHSISTSEKNSKNIYFISVAVKMSTWKSTQKKGLESIRVINSKKEQRRRQKKKTFMSLKCRRENDFKQNVFFLSHRH